MGGFEKAQIRAEKTNSVNNAYSKMNRGLSLFKTTAFT